MREQFIVYENPILHRENNGSNITISNGKVVNVIPVPESYYQCDFCGKDVDVQTDEGLSISVFVLNNNHALCWDCTKECFTQDITLLSNIGWCSCCTDEKANKWLYIEDNDELSPVAKFNSEMQVERFADLYVSLLGRNLICLTGELAEPLQEDEIKDR